MPSFNQGKYCKDCKHIDYIGGGFVCKRDYNETPELGETVNVYDKACLFFEEEEQDD